MLRSKFAFLVIFLFSLFAAAQQPASTTSESATKSKASVYIYRYKQFVGSALSPSVYCDEVQLARMDNGRYFKVSVDSGKHTFRSNDKQSGVDLDVAAGQDYFIRVEIAAGFMKGHGRLILTPAQQGRYEVLSSELKPLSASKVTDSARVSVEEAKFETPTPTPAAAPQAQTQAQPTLVQGQSTSHGPTMVTISSGGSETGSAGDDMSVAEASRRAKQKKAVQDGTAPQ